MYVCMYVLFERSIDQVLFFFSFEKNRKSEESEREATLLLLLLLLLLKYSDITCTCMHGTSNECMYVVY